MVHQKLSGALRPESYEVPKNSSFSDFSDTGLHQDLQVTLVQSHLKHVHDAEKPAIAQWPIDSGLLDPCDKFDLWLWMTITTCSQNKKHAKPRIRMRFKVTGLSKAAMASSSSDDLFSHNSFEGTPALRRSSRRKSFGWNAAEKTFICLLEDTT